MHDLPSLLLILQSPLPLELAIDSDGPPSLISAPESNGPPSQELAMDSAASPSPPPSEPAYDADSESEVACRCVLPNSGARPSYEKGQRSDVESIAEGGWGILAQFGHWSKSHLVS